MRGLLFAWVVCGGLIGTHLRGGDCDRDGVVDRLQAYRDPSLDCNRNGVLDDCDLQPSLSFRLLPRLNTIPRAVSSIAAGDFDADGDADLVATHESGSALFFFLNEGGRAFGAPRTMAFETSVSYVVAGDWDGDGDADLAVAMGALPGGAGAGIAVLRSIGDGSFFPGESYPGGTLSMLTSDLDGDGNLDIVSTSTIGSILWGNGDGTFIPVEEYPNLPASSCNTAIDDLDSDGDLDVVFCSSVQLFGLLNEGDRNFRGFPIVDGLNARSLDFADFDGDGRTDLVVTEPGQFRLRVMRGLGNGYFEEIEGLRSGRAPRIVRAEDFDADGRADLAVFYWDFADRFDFIPGVGDGSFFEKTAFFGGFSAKFARAVDVDLDGQLDLVSGSDAGWVEVAIQERRPRSLDRDLDGVPDECQSDCNLNGVPDALEIGSAEAQDCDGDAVPDECEVVAQLSFDAPKFASLSDAPEVIRVGDVDGDGREDLVATCGTTFPPGSQGLCVARGLGGGCFGPYALFRTQTAAYSLALGDFDGDRDLDAASGGYVGSTVTVLFNDGSGEFEEQRQAEAGPNIQVVQSGDIDGDGDSEIVVVLQRGIQLINLDGAGGFIVSPIYQGGFFGFGTVALADLDADGKLDLAAASLDGGAVLRFRGDGRGGFALQQSVPVALLGTSVAAGDFDGDSDLDLAAAVSNGKVRVLTNTGNGLFSESEELNIGGSPRQVEAADLDGDGRPEIVARVHGPDSSSRDSHLAVLRYGANGWMEPARHHAVTQAYRWLAAANLDEVAGVDLAVTSELSGDVSLLYSRPDGGLRSPSYVSLSLGSPADLDLGFIDQDAVLDLVVSSSRVPQGVALLSGSGDGGFHELARLDFAATSVRLVDFNADGCNDLVVGGTGFLTFLEGSGDGRFDVRGSFPTQSFFIHGIRAVDLEPDGDVDVAAIEWRGSLVRIFVNDGSGGFAEGMPLAVEPFTSVVESADLDGDGDSELLIGSYESVVDGVQGSLLLLDNLGGGRFGPSTRLLDTPVFHVAAGDLDGDDRPDLVVAHFTSAPPAVLWNGPEGLRDPTPLPFSPLVQEVLSLQHPAEPYSATQSALTDFDADGALDVLLLDTLSTMTVYRNAGGRRLVPAVVIRRSAQNPGVRIGLGIGDLDLDGDREVVLTEPSNSGPGGVMIFQGNLREPIDVDRNRDGVPDRCDGDADFQRGDANADGGLDLSDAVFALNYLFLGGIAPACLKAADANDDGDVNLSDAVWTLRYLFQGGKPVPPPLGDCGSDPTDDRLDCVQFDGCV